MDRESDENGEQGLVCRSNVVNNNNSEMERSLSSSSGLGLESSIVDLEIGRTLKLGDGRILILPIMDEEKLLEKLYDHVQKKFPEEMFDNMTEKLLDKMNMTEDKLESVYDKLEEKLHETIKQRLFKRLLEIRSRAAGKKRLIEMEKNMSDDLLLTETDKQLQTTDQHLRKLSKQIKKLEQKDIKDHPCPDKPSVHPLLIDHVLDTVFENFAPKYRRCRISEAVNLASFRLVCKTWNDRATVALRRAHPGITFGDGSESQSLNLKLLRYLDIMENSSLAPFRRFFFKQEILSPQNIKLLRRFIESLAMDAVGLEFYFGKNTSLATVIDIVSFNLARLERLEIKFDDKALRTDPRSNVSPLVKIETGIPKFIIQLLASAPNLKEFVLHENYGESRCLPEVLQLVPESTSFIFLNLQQLSNSHFTSLTKANVKLERLCLSCQWYNVDNDIVDDFFRKQDSLSSMNLIGISSGILHTKFPRLNVLVDLNIGCSYVPRLEICIADSFPNVSVLNLEDLFFNSDQAFEELFSSEKPDKPVESVQTLHLPTWIDEPWLLMDKIARKFPNVKKLCVRLNKHNDVYTITSVCTYYSEIEELYVSFSKVGLLYHYDGDAMLTGVSGNICKMLLRNNNFRQVHLEDFCERKSLLNLRKLKTLYMAEIKNRPAIITDLTAHHVFLKMKSLENVIILGSQISPYYKEQLKRKLKLFDDEEGRESENEDESDYIYTSDSNTSSDDFQVI